jgi:hypothetical protein
MTNMHIQGFSQRTFSSKGGELRRLEVFRKDLIPKLFLLVNDERSEVTIVYRPTGAMVARKLGAEEVWRTT